MTRIGRDRQREKCEHQRLPRPEQIVLFFLGVLFVRTCQYSRLCARVKGIRKAGRMRIAARLSALLCVVFLSSLM